MLKVIVVLVKAGSCPRGRNLDNRRVTLWLIFSTGSSSGTASRRILKSRLRNLAWHRFQHQAGPAGRHSGGGRGRGERGDKE